MKEYVELSVKLHELDAEGKMNSTEWNEIINKRNTVIEIAVQIHKIERTPFLLEGMEKVREIVKY